MIVIVDRVAAWLESARAPALVEARRILADPAATVLTSRVLHALAVDAYARQDLLVLDGALEAVRAAAAEALVDATRPSSP